MSFMIVGSSITLELAVVRLQFLVCSTVIDELIEEELWEMERSEALERERLMHQIDDYEFWEEQQYCQLQNQGNPIRNSYCDSPTVLCPICNSASLIATPFGEIQCTSAIAGSDQSSNTPQFATRCTFRMDIAHEGLTLHHLQNQLRTIYDEHSQVCTKGILKFHVEGGSRGNDCMTVLMATCDECSLDVVVF